MSLFIILLLVGNDRYTTARSYLDQYDHERINCDLECVSVRNNVSKQLSYSGDRHDTHHILIYSNYSGLRGLHFFVKYGIRFKRWAHRARRNNDRASCEFSQRSG